MKKGIRNLAYLIKQAVKNKDPKPIVFLGAGASVSGGIPLARGIIEKILKDFENNPAIIDLPEDKKDNYYELMSALTPKQRRDLFQGYIEEAKINIAHIYLAQLIEEGYVDYVLTVNFDDLLLRAAGLFNFTVPTYDISNISNFTTTPFQEKSIIYLHGQHYGEWLLNSKGELNKVKDQIPLLFNKICSDRTWIIVGYSGEDEVFNCIENFSGFNNELYWVGYLDYEPSEKVKKGLLNIQTKNTHLISGYDADTFFLKLHAELDLKNPKIMDKPFSFLKDMMKEIKEPQQENIIDKHKELYEGVSERMKITSQWTDEAVELFEKPKSIDYLKQEIIDATIKEDFNDELAESFENTIIQKNYPDVEETLSGYYNDWGNSYLNSADLKNDESLYIKAINKYKKASQLNPDDFNIYYNWGLAFYKLAKLKNDENLYIQSILKYQKACQLTPNEASIYINWGSTLLNLAKLKNDENLYKESFNKYKKASQLKPDDFDIYYNWGNALNYLAELKNDEALYEEAFSKYKKASQLNPNDFNIYVNWGLTIQNLAQLKNDENLYEEAFLKYEKAIQLKPDDFDVYYNWAIAIQNLAELKNDENLYEEAFLKYKKAIELKPDDSNIYDNWASSLIDYHYLLKINKKEDITILKQAKEKALLAYKYGGSSYNLGCVYALLEDKEKALKYLKETIEKKEVTKKHILKDEEWQPYLEDEDFKKLINNY